MLQEIESHRKALIAECVQSISDMNVLRHVDAHGSCIEHVDLLPLLPLYGAPPT